MPPSIEDQALLNEINNMTSEQNYLIRKTSFEYLGELITMMDVFDDFKNERYLKPSNLEIIGNTVRSLFKNKDNLGSPIITKCASQYREIQKYIRKNYRVGGVSFSDIVTYMGYNQKRIGSLLLLSNFDMKMRDDELYLSQDIMWEKLLF